MYLGIHGIGLYSEDAVLMMLRSTDKGDTYFKTLPIIKDPNTIECEVSHCCFIVKRISTNKQKLKVCIDVDPKCENLPDWLLNNICKVFSAVLLNQIAKRAESFKPEYQELYKKNINIYNFCDELVDRANLQRLLISNPGLEEDLFEPKQKLAINK